MERRDVLKTLAAASAGAALGGRVLAEETGTMISKTIPKSGEKLPVIGLGTSKTFDVGAAPADRAPLREVLEGLVAGGGTVVDSSPMYGRAEEVVGDLAEASGLGSKLFLATKVWTTGREAGIEQMEDSFRKLRTKRIDLMQVHNLVDLDAQLATVRSWKDAGRLRYVGVTHWNESAYEELEQVLRKETLDFVQLNYSIVEREAEKTLLPLAADRGVAVLVNRPFARGGLFSRVKGKPLPAFAAGLGATSWAQLFLKFVVSHPAVTCAIPATSDPAHLRENVGAGHGSLPDAKLREELASLVA